MDNDYIYFCPKCHFWTTSNRTNNSVLCLKCKAIMVHTGISKEEWNNNSKEEKLEFKQMLEKMYPKNNHQPKYEIINDDWKSLVLNILEKTNENVNTIKNILLIYFIASVVGLLIILMNSIN